MEGENAFQRKLAYLTEVGRKVGDAEVDGKVLSQVMLRVIDEKWKDHLYDLDQLRNAIQYRAYGQKDPLVEYKKEAFEMFEDLVHDLRSTFTEQFLKIQITVEPPRRPPPPPPPVKTNRDTDDLMSGAPARRPVPQAAGVPSGGGTSSSFGPVARGGSVPEVGRNDPCPCGSGKKYKKCHGAGV